MTALFALAPVTGLARQDNQDAAHAEAAGCSRSPTAATPPGMGTTLTAMLFSGGRAALAHSATPASFQLRCGQLPPDHRGPYDRQPCLGRRLARAGARTAPGRQARPSGRYRPTGPAGRWPLPAVLRRTQPGHRRPTAPECTHFACRIRRRAGQLAALAADRASVSRLTPYRCEGPCMRGKPAPGSHCLLRMRSCRSASIYGTARRPAARPPPPSCPMRLGVLAYHRRDNVPGQIRARIRPPGPSAKITQGARPLRQEPVHAT